MEAEVSRAAEAVESTSESLTAGERNRRRQEAESLRNRLRQVRELAARADYRAPGSGERDELLEGGVVGWGQDDLEEEERAAGAPTVQVKKSQEEMLREQDEGLDSLHSVISRQRRLAEAIGGEAESQVSMREHSLKDFSTLVSSVLG